MDREKVRSARALSDRLGERDGAVAAAALAHGRYRLLRELGSGMEAVVYLAEDRKAGGRLRAVKRYRAQSEDACLRELAMLVRLNHPLVPTLIDYVPAASGHPGGCLVTEYVQGETVAQRFRTDGHAAEERAVLELAVQICRLLAYLHSLRPEPVIFRDLKPDNLIVDRQGYVHLIDFGSARVYKPHGLLDTIQLGTVGFAAPEQYRQEQSDARTDLYALGAVMYYLLSGGQLHYCHPSPEAAGRRYLPDTVRIVKRLLMPDRDARYQTAEETLAALEKALRRAGRPLVRWARTRLGRS